MSLQRTIVKCLLATPMSLADLQLATQVSLPTLRRAVQELSDAHWIRIVGQAEANGGRPAMLFGIDDNRYAVVGVHLQLPGIRLILASLTGQVIEENEVFDNVVPTPDTAIQTIVDYIAQVGARFPAYHLLGIGIAAPGFIDLGVGDILSIGRVPSWGSVAICRRLQAAVNLPVQIANDVDCMALAELRYAHESRTANLAYVGFDEGVKVSLFLKGELYKGTLGNAGLLAPQLLYVRDLANPDDALRLLTINGVSRIFEEQVARLDAAAQQPYASVMAIGSLRERVHRILDSADVDMPVCNAIVHDQIKVLAVAIANVILLLQPDVAVIGGLLSLMPRDLFALLEIALRRHLPELISNNVIVQQGKLATQSSAAIGANQHFLQVYLNNVAGELA